MDARWEGEERLIARQQWVRFPLVLPASVRASACSFPPALGCVCLQASSKEYILCRENINMEEEEEEKEVCVCMWGMNRTRGGAAWPLNSGFSRWRARLEKGGWLPAAFLSPLLVVVGCTVDKRRRRGEKHQANEEETINTYVLTHSANRRSRSASIACILFVGVRHTQQANEC